jgi:hypothetical protein
MRRLGRRAAQIAGELRLFHWDNCKVDFDRGAAFRYAWGALRDGHEAKDIASSYDRALHECHAFATDRTAHCGQICRFDASSTVSRARTFLGKDGLTRAQRISRWRAQHRSATTDAGNSCKIEPEIGAKTRQSICR